MRLRRGVSVVVTIVICAYITAVVIADAAVTRVTPRK